MLMRTVDVTGAMELYLRFVAVRKDVLSDYDSTFDVVRGIYALRTCIPVRSCGGALWLNCQLLV